PKGRQVQWRCERGQCYPMYVQPVYPAIVQQQPSRPTVPRPVDQPAPSLDMDEVLRDVKIEVVSWLESNREQLRGSDGQDGNSPELDLNELADVITSKYSERIRGQDGESVSPAVLSAINARLSMLEQGRRVLIIDGDTVLDDETYKPGEAIVLDVQRLTQS
ncbi:MAG: hypothetical protein NXI04_15230, partial [Planctomycetaceae bacterium]|nr:hypothetical protein [Planctomycetaceae bacterium]